MKKIILCFITLTIVNFITAQQVAVADFIHLEEGVDSDYNTLEKIWMPFHNSEIKAGKKMFWAVWKIDNGPEMEKAPDYVVFNIFKDENQQKSYMKNWDGDMSRKKIESLNRGKYSKSTIKNIMNKSTRVENVDLCLSQDAVAVFAIEGFDGLYRISKKNKKRLKACFNKFPDNKQACMSFLSLASVELNSLINYRMSKLRLDNLLRCYQYFIDSHSKPTDKRRMPNYYMYNPNILKTQKNLELLFKFGYMRMQHMKFFDSKNAEIVRDKDIYTLLHDSYSTFKS